jgi:hypothetical protein
LVGLGVVSSGKTAIQRVREKPRFNNIYSTTSRLTHVKALVLPPKLAVVVAAAGLDVNIEAGGIES